MLSFYDMLVALCRANPDFAIQLQRDANWLSDRITVDAFDIQDHIDAVDLFVEQKEYAPLFVKLARAQLAEREK
jgi:hypothetical protein|tara:strand:- start:109 stop:330 length:222 start_codon:yes stop_codon:yes gene_type:complete